MNASDTYPIQRVCSDVNFDYANLLYEAHVKTCEALYMILRYLELNYGTVINILR